MALLEELNGERSIEIWGLVKPEKMMDEAKIPCGF